ncbi:hypothetical protein Tco_0449779 [Tanacetum coccineum]
MTLEGVNARVTKLAAVQEQDLQDVYAVIEDTQDRQTQLFQSVDGLVKDRHFHYETARLLDREALISREAWAHSVGLSSTVHYELQAYRTHTQMQDYRIALQESLMTTLIAQNNMPPRRSSATARAAATAAAKVAAAATPMTAAAVEKLIKVRVSAALANHETLQNITNGYGDRRHNSETRIRGTVCTPRECTYKDFMNCKPLTFKGTERVVVLSQWFEKMESVFHISNCAVENQVKFATCTFLRKVLTWWNSYMKTVTQDVNEARGAKDALGILFWGVMHKRFRVITSWDFCYDLKSSLSNVEQFKPLRFVLNNFNKSNVSDSPFELVAYTDSNYARATQDRKSTIGGCQFLGNRLISSQCKKQTVVATSITKAEYVAAASCCGQVLWIQN